MKSLIGYRVAGNVNTPAGILMPRESFNWQGVVGYEFGNGLSITASYLSSPTSYKFRPNPHSNWALLGDFRIRHLMAGLTYTHTAPFPAILPFGGVRIGGVSFNSSTPSFGSTTRFAVSLEGGVKIPFTPRFGIVTQIDIFSPLMFSSSNLFDSNMREYNFEAGSGIFPQFALNSGLYFNFY